MSRKSAKRPSPRLLSWAMAETNRSRSAGVRVCALLRIRTMTRTDPTSLPWKVARTVTSPGLELGRPNRPARKNDTDCPPMGSITLIWFTNVPVAPARKTTAPAAAADWPERVTTELGVVAAGLVMRTRQGIGAQPRNRAEALEELLISI